MIVSTSASVMDCRISQWTMNRLTHRAGYGTRGKHSRESPDTVGEFVPTHGDPSKGLRRKHPAFPGSSPAAARRNSPTVSAMEQETGIGPLYAAFFRGYWARIRLVCPDFRPNSTYKQSSTSKALP